MLNNLVKVRNNIWKLKCGATNLNVDPFIRWMFY
jgi:hypothetical protein